MEGLRVFENGVLRRIFGLMRDEVSFMICTFHQVMIKLRRMRLAGHVA
jgi:hypothetical protein